MKRASIKTVAKKMKNLDLCNMITQDGRGTMYSRPMSNNGKVEFDGTSWFFTYEGSSKVRHIETNPKVALVFQRNDRLFIECYGVGSIVRRRSMMEELWVDSLSQWFPDGLDTPGICLVKVAAKRVHFWDRGEEGEYRA